MKKIFVLFLVACLVVPCFFITVSAERLNYLDYITNVQVDQGRSVVTIDLPCSSNRYDIENSLNGSVSSYFAQSTNYFFEAYSTSGIDYDIKFSPSWSNKTVNALNLRNLPAKTELNIWLDVECFDRLSGEAVIPSVDFTWGSNGALWYYLKDGVRVSTQKTEFGLWSDSPIEGDNLYTFQFFCTGILTDPTQPDSTTFRSADSFYPTFYLNNVKFNQDTELRFTISRYQLVFHLEDFLLGGEYTRVLDTINEYLAEQGKYLDTLSGAVKYKPIADKPFWDDLATSNTDKETSIIDRIQGSVLGAVDLAVGIKDDIVDLAPSFLAVKALVHNFTEIPIFNFLITCAIIFGSLAVILNLGFQYYDSTERRRLKNNYAFEKEHPGWIEAVGYTDRQGNIHYPRGE